MDKQNTENMNRRQFVKLVAGTTATAAVPLAGCNRVASSKSEALGMVPPNIIFIRRT